MTNAARGVSIFDFFSSEWHLKLRLVSIVAPDVVMMKCCSGDEKHEERQWLKK